MRRAYITVVLQLKIAIPMLRQLGFLWTFWCLSEWAPGMNDTPENLKSDSKRFFRIELYIRVGRSCETETICICISRCPTGCRYVRMICICACNLFNSHYSLFKLNLYSKLFKIVFIQIFWNPPLYALPPLKRKPVTIFNRFYKTSVISELLLQMNINFR